MFAALLLIMLQPAMAGCPDVTTMPDVNLTEYVAHTWYVQVQQINQYQQPEDLNCVTATYNQEGKTVPGFDGLVVTVYNYDNVGGVNQPSDNPNNRTLCARRPDDGDSAKLLVAPCFLPNALSGQYWILGAGPSSDDYQWAVVVGGQPTVETPDGCTTRNDTVNGAGLWVFSRTPILAASYLHDAYEVLYAQGITTKQLLLVPQTGCKYAGATIKP